LARSSDFVMAPLAEAALILIAGAAGWALHKAFLFASLGPTAYELIETPERQSARPYNLIAGHLIGVLSAFAALWITHAGSAPSPSPESVPLIRVGSAVIAAGLTVLCTLLAKATQPAALSTTLLLALGIMRGWLAGVDIMAAVLLMTAVGEPMRRWRERQGARGGR
jgi:CBS domain-containing membrane protein